MNKAGLVDIDGNVINVIQLKEGTSYTPPEGLSLFKGEEVSIGDTVVDEVLIPQPPPKEVIKEPIEEWGEEMSATDRDLPRYIEDIIDALEAPVRARIATETIDKYKNKKALRAGKPT